MATTQAHVTPEVLRWARESHGYSREQAAARIGVREDKLARAEAGEELLTLRQAERAADTYERPLAALFLSEPPAEEPQEAQFRHLPGAPEPPWPPEMQALARRVRRRQEAAADLYDLLEEIPPWEETSSRLQTDEPARLARERAFHGVGPEASGTQEQPARIVGVEVRKVARSLPIGPGAGDKVCVPKQGPTVSASVFVHVCVAGGCAVLRLWRQRRCRAFGQYWRRLPAPNHGAPQR